MSMANDKCQYKNDLYTGINTLNSFNYLKLFTNWWDIILFCVGVVWRGAEGVSTDFFMFSPYMC